MTLPPPITRRQDEGRPLAAEEAAAAAAAMAGHPYFAGFPAEALAALIAGGARMVAALGTRLIHRGDRSTFALLVIEGAATVTIDTPYEHVELARHEAPAVIGEIAAFTGVARTAHVDAATAIVAVRLSAEALEAAGRAHPRLLSAVMRQFGTRFETFNRAFGFYANALNALERRDFDLKLLDELRNPLPELVDFSHSFRRLAEAIMMRGRSGGRWPTRRPSSAPCCRLRSLRTPSAGGRRSSPPCARRGTWAGISTITSSSTPTIWW